jgi:hypothetical protein
MREQGFVPRFMAQLFRWIKLLRGSCDYRWFKRVFYGRTVGCVLFW